MLIKNIFKKLFFFNTFLIEFSILLDKFDLIFGILMSHPIFLYTFFSSVKNNDALLLFLK